MNMSFKLLLMSATLLCSSVANAVLITDTKDWGAGTSGQFIDYGLTGFDYRHDLSGLGFKAGVSNALSGTLAIELTDDGWLRGDSLGDLIEYGIDLRAPDFVTVIVEQLDLQDGGIRLLGTLLFNLPAGGPAMAAINGDGFLDITIRGTFGLHDFYLNSSTLTIDAENLVPAPATLALFGLGLLGLGAVRQRSRA